MNEEKLDTALPPDLEAQVPCHSKWDREGGREYKQGIGGARGQRSCRDRRSCVLGWKRLGPRFRCQPVHHNFTSHS